MGGGDIKALRAKLDLSQADLAQALGVKGRLVVFRWEAGQREPSETIKRFVRLLNAMSDKDARRLLRRLEDFGEG